MSLRIVLSRDPQLSLKHQVFLEEVKQVTRRHGASSEKLRAHPPLFKIIRRLFVGEYVYEELVARPESCGDVRHEQLVVLHMLEQFY